MHPMKEILARRAAGESCGIASYCSANELVIEAALRRAKINGKPVLIEATANQVNQYGGYTGMTPAQFYQKMMAMADAVRVDRSLVILGGDHLGPLTWSNLPEGEAMPKAEKLVYDFVRAGFTKIHLDTSMRLADDTGDTLEVATIARRGVQLYRIAMDAYQALLQENPQAVRPVFVIGSEVPIPGGATEAEDSLSVTTPAALEETYRAYDECFRQNGFPNGMEDVIAIVVQPGVEFGDDQVFQYDRAKAAELRDALKAYPGLCLEGHSTDYQGTEQLKQMCEDGIAILKVGPALTFGLRETLFALCAMERELLPDDECSHFAEVLEQEMMTNPQNWIKHYHGSEQQKLLARKYSLSDRSRYYMNNPAVEAAIDKLFQNLRSCKPYPGLLHQYLPDIYNRCRDKGVLGDPRDWAIHGVEKVMDDYEYATL